MHKSLEICENKLKIDKSISRFTIPFFTTLQADGSAIFIVISTIFLANYSNFTLNTIDYVIVLIETSILCTCLPSIPSSSIVTILVVLNSINLNGSNLAILYTVEWLLDRLRTTVNLYSHDFCAVITNHLLMNSNYNNNNEIELNSIDYLNSKETIISI
jgi:Na+/H+-dicarboxylate symporter